MEEMQDVENLVDLGSKFSAFCRECESTQEMMVVDADCDHDDRPVYEIECVCFGREWIGEENLLIKSGAWKEKHHPLFPRNHSRVFPWLVDVDGIEIFDGVSIFMMIDEGQMGIYPVEQVLALTYGLNQGEWSGLDMWFDDDDIEGVKIRNKTDLQKVALLFKEHYPTLEDFIDRVNSC